MTLQTSTPSITIPTDPQGRLATAYLAWTDAAGNPQVFVPDLVLEESWTGNATITENPVEIGANVTDNIRIELRKCALKFFLTNEPIERNNWTTVSFAPTTLSLPAKTITPAPNPIVLVPEWQNNLQARVLLGTAGGRIAGGLGASAASLLASSLLAGRAIDVPVRVNAGQFPATPAHPPLTLNILTPDVTDDFVLLSIEWLEQLKDAGQTMNVYGTKTTCIGTTQGVGGMAIESLTWVRAQDDGTGATVTLGLKQIRVVQTATVPAPAPSIPRAKKATNGGNQQTSELGDAASDAMNNLAEGFKQGSSDAESLFSGGD